MHHEQEGCGDTISGVRAGVQQSLAPAFYLLSPSIDLHRLKQQNSNNEFFFIGFHQSCFARGLANFSVGTTVFTRKRSSLARG
jgi:hypothetical protein